MTHLLRAHMLTQVNVLSYFTHAHSHVFRLRSVRYSASPLRSGPVRSGPVRSFLVHSWNINFLGAKQMASTKMGLTDSTSEIHFM